MIVKKITEVIGKRVYTDSGDFFGEIQDVNLIGNKVDGWKIKVGGDLLSLLGGAKGVIIPHNFVKAVSDIFIINKAAIPNHEPSDISAEESGGNDLI
jgi:sporulation protein YlmC with PRC-barrel domain